MTQYWQIRTLLVILVLSSTPQTCLGDWNLVIAHSNDLWFQLDEIQANDSPCYRDLPDPTSSTTASTEASTTSTETTTLSSSPTTTETTISSTESTSTTGTNPSPLPTSDATQEETSSNSPSEENASDSTAATSPTLETSTAEQKTGPLNKASSATPTVSSRSPKLRQNDENVSTSDSFVTTVTSPSSYNVSSSTVHLNESNQVNSTSTSVTNSNVVSLMTTPITSKPPVEDLDPCYGGVARHLTAVNEFKNKSSSDGKAFLHLNAGGMLGGYIWYPILGPDPIVESIQMLQYDALALGYRDFDEGVSMTVEYLKKLNESNIPVLCANMDVTDEPAFSGLEGLFEKSKILERNGQKIGIIGFIGKDADYMADTGKIKFEDEVTAINREVAKLFEQNVHLIIALGSAGYDRAKYMLDNALNIDVLISGGSKSVFQYNGTKGPLNENVDDPYPTMWQHVGYGERLLVTTSRYGKYIGRLELTVDDEGVIKNHSDSESSKPILLKDPEYAPDEKLQELVDDWERTVLIQSNETIGYTKIPITSDRKVCWYRECSGASMMADAARWYLENNVTVDNVWRDSIAATVWHGGALSDTDLSVAPGPIQFGDILYMFPYANLLAMSKMNGSVIKYMFEKSVEFYGDPNRPTPNLGEFLHVSGMRVEYDLSQKPYNRVSRITIRDTSNPSGGLALLNPDTEYLIGMPSFIARGGSQYGFMDNIKYTSTDIRDEVALKSFITWTSPLSYGNDGRIVFLDAPVEPVPCPSTNVTGTVFLTIFLTLLFAGLIFAAYKYLYPKLRERRGSLMSLVR